MHKRDLRKVLPPGPGAPAALQLLATWTRPTASLLSLRQRYGKRVTVQLPFQPPFVILSDPEDIKQLFTAAPELVHPGEGARVLEPLIGRNSVILLDEGAHLEQRKLMLPAFGAARMQRLSGLMCEIAEREIASWPVGEAIALHPRLQRLTLEIVLRAVFGLEHGPQLRRLSELLTQVLALSENPLSVLPAIQRFARWTGPMRRFADARRQADAMIFALIDQRRADQGAASGERDDVLSTLLAARHEHDGSPMSPQELRDELLTALVAGHETTASQLAWLFERLSRSPDVMARLVGELDAGQSNSYLTATINETLRIKPVLPNAEPRLTKQPVRIGTFTYPAGVSLVASAFLVHHDPDLYPEPGAFRPERFLDKAPGTYTWLPFGGGRRRCLGAGFAMLEMKVVLRAVLARYAVAPSERPAELTARRGITFSPANGATVVLAQRTPESGGVTIDPRIPAAV